ncbi:phytoene desaturase family protein [Sutcliffiella halmapala]|uniref:phytoene desaturase family protein n=1 Tax=Sutcliffiella halmapala TaxID=79882 RepID=UPI0009959D58|nr:FAD-dependent oxidoreductase [Sutcliffiella halmapala]
MKAEKNRYDCVVIGGGLTGLTAAVYLAKAGQSVLLLEKEHQLGGLAQTTNVNGALFNLGPHAMYEGGAALRILREWNLLPKGGYASKSGMAGIYEGKIVNVPTDLTPEESQEWSKIMSTLSEVQTESLYSISITLWAETNIYHDRVRLLFYAMCRQWAYCNNLSELSCGYVIKQGQLAGKGVRYVEHGWQTVVDSLRNEAEKFGATIVTGVSAKQITLRDGKVHGVILSDGKSLEVNAVITAIGPREVCELVQDSEHMSLGKWQRNARPLYGSCLDVALKQLPNPSAIFVLGLDEPLYYSNHSVSVKLSDNGSHILHTMKYNDSNRHTDATEDEKRLLQLLDLLQPGWEKEVVATRFSHNVLIAHDSRTIHHYGGGPAPSPIVPEVYGLFVTGDWVGAEGRLADNAMASAKLAVEELLHLYKTQIL